MPRSGPTASTEGRTPGEEQGWKQELITVSQLAQTLPARCQSGTPLAKARLPVLLPLQQPPDCPSLGTEGSVLGSSCQGAGGTLWAATCVGCGSTEVPHSSPCGSQCDMGRNIPARALPAPRQSHCEGEDPVPASQLVQINQHRTDVSAGSAMGCAGQHRNFLKGTSSISSLLCLSSASS